MAWQRWGMPTCECCTGSCSTSFLVTACCQPAASASLYVINSASSVLSSCVTNSAGICSLNLSAYSSLSLWGSAVYNSSYYAPLTSALLGNVCGRTYQFDVPPTTDTGSCGSLTITTTQCDGTTLYGGQAWTLQKWNGAAWATYATGTTDATTAKSTVTGATYGGANDQYRWLVTDATGPITGTSFTLTSTNCSASTTMRMATSTRLPCTSPNDSTTLSGGGSTGQRGCCSSCWPATIPHLLTLSDPCAFDGASSGCACGCISDTVTLAGTTGCTNNWGGVSTKSCGDPYGGYHSGLQYTLTCNGTNATLAIQGNQFCVGTVGSSLCFYYGSGNSGSYTAATFTCSPFAATFTIPAVTMTGHVGGLLGAPCGSFTIPGRTITVTQ